MRRFILLFRNGVVLCFLILCVGRNSMVAQCKSCGPNLVPNADFEITTAQCKEKDNQLYTNQTPLQDWYGTACTTCPGKGITPDNFNSGCGGNGTNNCGSGAGSAGVFTSTGSGNAREYIQAKLKAPLKAGRQYCVSVKVKSSGGSFIPTDGAGIWFNSIGKIDIDAMNGGSSFLGPGSKINATPQIQNAAGNIIGACQTLSGNFCAKGGEEWIVLGNFKKDNELQPFTTCDCEVGGACGTKCTNCLGSACLACPCKGSAYVIFDEVSVQESCTTVLTVAATANPAIIKCGDCTNISATTTGGDGKYTYTWIPNIGTGPGPHKVCPLTNTTYTVIANSNGNCGPISDTSTVTVTVDCGPVVVVTSTKICKGTCNSIKATASGGTPPYVYSWSPATGLSATSGDSVYACPLATTNYTVTVTDKNGTGLSASATSVVTVNPKPPIKLSSATLCSGACDTIYASGAGAGGVYTWLVPLTGNTDFQRVCPATSTTYSVAGTDINGCKDTATSIVTVNALPQITSPDAGICPGGSTVLTATGATTYTWSPPTGLSSTTGSSVTANPTVSTTYTVCGTTAGCTSCKNVNVTVGTLIPTISADSSICAGSCVQLKAQGGTQYSWSPATGLNDPTSASPIACPATTTTYTVTVSDGTCSGTAQVKITVIPLPVIVASPATICSGACDTIYASGAGAGGKYTWLLPLNGTTNFQRVCPATTTTYSVIGTDANGCKDTATSIVTVNALPQIIAADAGICPGGSTVLTATGATTYTWSPPTGLSGTTGASVTASPPVSTTYTVCGTTAGCTSCKNVKVSVGALIPRVTADSSVCIGSCMQLKAVGGTQYSWAPATGLNDPAIANPIACPTTTTTYTVTVSDGTCSGTAQVKITVMALPVIVASPAKICKGETAILKASGADHYIWSPATSLNTSTGSIVNATPTITTTYTINGTSAAGCKAMATVLVTVYPPPTVIAKGGSCCIGEQVQLKAQGALTYSWSPGTGLVTTTDSVVTASPKQTVIYTVTGMDGNGCKATDTALLTIFPKPHAAFITSPDRIDNFYPVVYFTDQSYSQINFWKWNFGDVANSTSFVKDPTFTYPHEIGDYPVKLLVTNEYGCKDSTTKNVHIGGVFTFYVPNVFTPDNNGINENFTPKGIGIDETDYELWIFDRWGDLIWQTHTWGEAWDGKANGGGTLAQIDTYVWKAKVREKETHKVHIYIGHVNIVK
jgi:gliding motility-associated-like protein